MSPCSCAFGDAGPGGATKPLTTSVPTRLDWEDNFSWACEGT